VLVLAAGRPPSSCLLPPAKKRSEDGKARQCWKGREVGQEKNMGCRLLCLSREGD